MTGTTGVTVVVVAYGNHGDLERCVGRLGRSHPLIVVDNAGTAECAALVASVGGTYLRPGANIGFAAAVNRALDVVMPAGDDVLLLNPDAVIDGAGVARLAVVLNAPGNERVAAVAPRQRGDGPGEQVVAWPFPSPAGTWADALGAGRLLRRWRFLAGSVLLLRHRAVADVGRFDERFFLYAEEADWQWRARQRGWTVLLCDDVVAHHRGAGSSTHPETRDVLFHSSAELLLRKWYGAGGWASARAATVVGALVRAAWRRGDERRAALARARLYLRGPRRVAATLAVR